MLIIIISFLIVTIPFAVFIIHDWKEYKGENAFRIYISIEIILVFTLIGAFVATKIGEHKTNCYYETRSQKIISLKDNREVKGNTFLGLQNIGTEVYYYYMIESPSGIKLQKISSDSCCLKYSDEPRIEYNEATEFKDKSELI